MDKTSPINPPLKRKRQPSGGEGQHKAVRPTAQNDASSYPPQAHATQADAQQRQHLQVNYLARQYSNDLPLISYDDTCPNLIGLLNDYNAVFDRHESLATNLGAHSTGTEWVRRFERMFDAPPRIVSHPSGFQPNVTWLDIVDFASTFPDHFNLSSEDQVPRLCEIHIKDCDVVISEQDFRAIKSGGLQNMIPSQPVAEDEEKELGTLQILERSINEVVHFADKVALRGRVFVRRLGERKAAIIERRAADLAQRLNGSSPNGAPNSTQSDSNTDPALTDASPLPANPALVSPAIHDELTHSFTVAAAAAAQHTRAADSSLYIHRSPAHPRPTDARYATVSPSLQTPDHTMQSHAIRPLASAEHDGLFKAEMIARTEAVARGQRIYPPCDRCRRLRTDCVKNLTACAGCTKKHAKCSWRDVKAEELNGPVPPPLGYLAASASVSTPTGASGRSASAGAGRTAVAGGGQMVYPFVGKGPVQMHLPEGALYAAYPALTTPPPPEQQQQEEQQQQVYEPAYDPSFDEPDHAHDQGVLAGDVDHDERDADRARIQAAARSLAMAAMHRHLADGEAGGGDDLCGEQQDGQQEGHQQQGEAPQAQMSMDAGAGGMERMLQGLKEASADAA